MKKGLMIGALSLALLAAAVAGVAGGHAMHAETLQNVIHSRNDFLNERNAQPVGNGNTAAARYGKRKAVVICYCTRKHRAYRRFYVRIMSVIA